MLMKNERKNKPFVKKDRQIFYYIYKITFLRGYPTGRYYIGKRTYCGPSIIQDKYAGSGTFCFAYYKKYGKIAGDTYIKEILEINPSQKINRDREDYWVGTKYKDDPLCMNIVAGGAGSADHDINCYVQDQYKKDINQYELDGTFIRTWHGIREAARELRVNRSGITNCLSGKKPSAFGYQWKYYEGNTDNIRPHQSVNPVDQFSIMGDYIASFNSPSIASKETGICSGSILEVCRGNGKRKTAGGFVWRFKGENFDKYSLEHKPSSRVYTKRDRELWQLNLNGALVKTWKNVDEAAKTLNIAISSIYMVTKGRRKSAGGYKWIFTDQLSEKEVISA